MAREVLRQPQLLPGLLRIGLSEGDDTGSRACWVVEFVCREDLRLLYPLLDTFVAGLAGLGNESSIRPMAKICEMLTQAYYTSGGMEKPPLTENHKELLAARCFDWLIGPHKVAARAYSMECLYLLGSDFEWIRPELKGVLEVNYPSAGPAFQARARRLLNLLGKAE